MLGAIASVSLKRITKYLNADELEEEKNDLIDSYQSEEQSEEKPKRSRNAVAVKDGSFSWNKDGETCLKNIDLKVEKNSLIAVVGKVGKQTLLLKHYTIAILTLTNSNFRLWQIIACTRTDRRNAKELRRNQSEWQHIVHTTDLLDPKQHPPRKHRLHESVRSGALR